MLGAASIPTSHQVWAFDKKISTFPISGTGLIMLQLFHRFDDPEEKIKKSSGTL
jgi:hypothetical protein